MDTYRTSRTRRIVFPLLILVMAAVIAYTTTRPAAEPADVQRHVLWVCEQALAGRDLTGRLNPVDPFTERRTIDEIRRVCAAPDAAASLQIIVTSGDAVHIGPIHDQATHTAMLRRGGQDLLGLRVLYVDARDIRIIGYWLP